MVPARTQTAGVGSEENVHRSFGSFDNLPQEVSAMRFLRPTETAYAHCDLPCGVYDPAQARIEAESIMKIMEKYSGFHEDEQKWRAVFIKEQRAELVKHNLWVLWQDYFKPE